MRSTLPACLFLIICLVASETSFAWGRRGHDIVAEIAFHYLDSTDKEKIRSYLGDMSLMEAANWLDEVRQDPAYAYTAPWHYVDFPKGTAYQPTNQPNIVNALSNAIQELDNKQSLTQEQIRFDLLCILHLTGDINQPLHVGYPDDKGGNTYQISYVGQGTNLHRVWDSQIIEDRNITADTCLAIAEHMTAMHGRVPLFPVNVISWLNATHELTAGVYPQGHKIDNDYISKQVPVIERQLALAGIELFKALHEVAQHLDTVKQVQIIPAERTNEVSLDDLSNHVGETVHVCARVYGVKTMSTGSRPTFINVGAAYPNSPLTLFITEDVRGSFSYKPEEQLDGKDICVTGKLELYKGKPEIVIKKESDIEIK